jgi:hypothetical protein
LKICLGGLRGERTQLSEFLSRDLIMKIRDYFVQRDGFVNTPYRRGLILR